MMRRGSIRKAKLRQTQELVNQGMKFDQPMCAVEDEAFKSLLTPSGSQATAQTFQI